ncbi:MAG: hypothetical protein AAF092_14080 [Pseudomonadota bacterium]
MAEPRNYRRKLKGYMSSFDEADAYIETDAYKLTSYERDGSFDYEMYKDIQVTGNKAKLGNQWVGEDHIEILAGKLIAVAGEKPFHGVCHGTRRGNEQAWFEAHLPPSSDVFGTEISDTAAEFPKTIQWDFHDTKDEWADRFDFIYSNSWDHTYDPKKLFHAWCACLAPGGMMLLDHGWNYQTGRVDALDAFGISEENLVSFLNTECGSWGAVTEVIDGGKHRRFPIRTILFQRKP